MGLNGSALARLLIIQKLRLPLKPHRGKKRCGDGNKLTAHFHGDAIVRRFRAYANSQGIETAKAAKKLFEGELNSRRLWKKLKLPKST
jgi:hypothetical protein